MPISPRLKAWRATFEEWYRGKYVPPPPNDPSSELIFISPGKYEPTPFAKSLRVCVEFWKEHWKWIIGATIAIAAVIYGK